ncbi:hypothetical protein, partial [Citrobacter freundii]
SEASQSPPHRHILRRARTQVRAFFSYVAQHGGDIAPLKVSALLIAGSGMHETYHAGFLHQITPDPPVQIAGNDLHSGLLFLKQPAAEAITHCLVLRSLPANTPGCAEISASWWSIALIYSSAALHPVMMRLSKECWPGVVSPAASRMVCNTGV